MKGDALDPKALIFESFRMEGITASECRTIFLDWALSLPVEHDTASSLKLLIEKYAADNPDHPMMDVMRQGLTTMGAPRRRGGWRSRPRN
jgi:hypothetical protein